MTRKKSPTTNTEALDQAHASAARVLATIASVLRKFPEETLAPRLRPFVQGRRTTTIGRSSDGRELVIAISTYSSDRITVQFPVALLDAPEAHITKWTREQYWSEKQAARRREQQEAQAKLTRARNALTQAECELEKAKDHFTRATDVAMRATNTEPKRRVKV